MQILTKDPKNPTMSAHHHTQPPQSDPRELELARRMWSKFTEMSKLAVVATCGLLVLMALFLL